MQCNGRWLILLCGVVAAHAAEPKPTFSSVWPVIEKRCVSCHVAGGIAPMAFTSYKETRPWAAAIKEAVASRTMPPWHAGPGTHPFRNDRSLSQSEIADLTAWAAGGGIQGDPIRAWTAPVKTDKWKLGTPDYVIELPTFPVPAKGVMPYTFLIVPLHLEHDTWVRAAEFQIEQSSVVHHMNAFTKPPRSSWLEGFPIGEIFVPTVADRGKRREGEGAFARRELLLGYEPGYEPSPWLEDGAKLVRAGSLIVLEMHYTPNGTAVTDHSKLALYFSQSPPARRIVAIDTLRDLDLAIPPDDRNYVSQAAFTLAAPATLLSIQPHMHMRGKSMEVRAVYPGGREDELLDVPRYDFHWQTTYFLRHPLALPAGTKLQSTARYDNSVNNGFNPDHNALVHWGDQTTDEMHIAFLELVIDASSDVESLLKEQPKMIGASQAKQ